MMRTLVHKWRRGVLSLWVVSAVLLLIGCDEQPQVAVYSVPKEEVRPIVMEPSREAAPQAPVAGAMPYRVPEDWQERDEPGAMRVATFDVGQGDNAIEVAVSRFPGDVGGLLANVNRWRGQVGLGPVTEAELDGVVEPFDGSGGFHGHTMRLRGPDQHLLGAAIHEHGANRTWFVKVTAPPEVADQHAEAVFAFARSFGDAARGGE
jgi:hypothetical protein